MDDVSALEDRVDVLWQRICALETMLQFALAHIAMFDERACERMEDLMCQMVEDELPGNVTPLFEDPGIEVKDALASLLVRTSKTVHPPLKVPPAIAARAQRFREV